MVSKKVPTLSPRPPAPASSVYISHCCTQDQHRQLLKLANILQQEYCLEVILDIASEVDINCAGGMCQWLPQALKRADRILVILSKSYLATLNAEDKGPDACKVRAELREINRVIYDKLQSTNKVVVVSDNIDADMFPDSLKGRPSFLLPYCGSAKSMGVRQIAHALCDKEMYTLPSQENNAFENTKTDDKKFEEVDNS